MAVLTLRLEGGIVVLWPADEELPETIHLCDIKWNRRNWFMDDKSIEPDAVYEAESEAVWRIVR